MISSCPVVVTLVSLVRRRARRRLFVAWQVLVVVIDIVVKDIWRPRGGVVLAARVPARLPAVLVGRRPMIVVLVSGAGVLAIRVTYIVGALGRRVGRAVVASVIFGLGFVVGLARRGRVGGFVGGVAGILGRATSMSLARRRCRARRVGILSRRVVGVTHARRRRVRWGSVVLRHVVWWDHWMLCLEHRGPIWASRRALEVLLLKMQSDVTKK